MIYLCRNKRNGFVKIGFSLTPEHREKTLQSEEPELFFEHVFPGSMAKETEMHRRFAHRRLRGEWFELTAEDVSEIVSILSPPDEPTEEELALAQAQQDDLAREELRAAIEIALPKMTEKQIRTVLKAIECYEEGVPVHLVSDDEMIVERSNSETEGLAKATEQVFTLLEPLQEWIKENAPAPF